MNYLQNGIENFGIGITYTSSLLGELISCKYSLSWRCTKAAVLSVVRAQTFSSSTDWTSSSFSRSSLICTVSRCLGTPDTAGWKQHHNAPEPVETANTNWRFSGTYPPTRWLLCLVWCGMWWWEPERRRCRYRWDLPALTLAVKSEGSKIYLKWIYFFEQTASWIIIIYY